MFIMTDVQPSENDPLLRSADPQNAAPHGIRINQDGTIEALGSFWPLGKPVSVQWNGREYVATVHGNPYSNPPAPKVIDSIAEGDRVLFVQGAGWDRTISEWLRKTLIEEVRAKYEQLDLPGTSA